MLAVSACIAALAGCGNNDDNGSGVQDTSPILHIVSPAAGGRCVGGARGRASGRRKLQRIGFRA